MSTLAVNAITNAAGGNTATINGMTPTADSLQGFRNRIINGDMRIDQRNAGASVTISNTDNAKYPVDRFFAIQRTDGAYTAQQSSVAPAGFNKSVLITVTTADASLGSTQFSGVFHSIEGFNTADFGWGTAGASAVTLSFWVRSSVAGTFGGSLRNSALDRAYLFSYTISATNTWEQKSITIAGDTSGTWVSDNGIGIRLTWSLGCGSSFLGTAGAWASGDLRGATGETNLLATNGATFYITGVQLEAGSVATPFERRPYGAELQLCQRYFYQQVNYMGQSAPYSSENSGAHGYGTGTTTVYRIAKPHPVQMRATPTVTYANINVWDGNERTVTGVVNNNSSIYTRSMDYTLNAASAAAGNIATEFITASGYIACSAEL